MTKAHADLKENYALAAIYISQLEEERGELLEALRGLIPLSDLFDARSEYAEEFDAAEKAIKKAEGK